jgi:hypothetical protein
LKLTPSIYILVLKKVTALFFLTLFLFNLVGYRLVVDYMQQKANDQLEARLDNNAYDESQLMELKIPMHLAYQNSSASYQRCNGEIEINGVLYKYVKRRVDNDTLFLMCIANTKKMHLQTAKDDFFKVSNDLAQNNGSKKSDNSKSAFQNLQGEYDRFTPSSALLALLASRLPCWPPKEANQLLSAPHISPEQPPDFIHA